MSPNPQPEALFERTSPRRGGQACGVAATAIAPMTTTTTSTTSTSQVRVYVRG